jgi:hypothetical protein
MRKDGIVKSHQLSPITLHDNPYQPLYIEDKELLTFNIDVPIETEEPPDTTEKGKKLKRKQKTSRTTKQKKGFDFEFDFTDEGYPPALFQTGGEQMKQDYETNKRAKSISPASSSDSKSSLEIYYKALRTYPPEMGESNAESADRTRLI